MRVFASVLLSVVSAFAYEVTSPNSSQGWNTTGPNILVWTRVTTDPTNFTAVLTNVNSTNNQILDTNVDGTTGIAKCDAPAGGWPPGSGFRVNLVQDAQNLNGILAQSGEFNITAVSSNGSTTSSSTQTTTGSSPSASSSATSTTPTGVSAASLVADTRAGLLTAVAALAAFMTTLF